MIDYLEYVKCYSNKYCEMFSLEINTSRPVKFTIKLVNIYFREIQVNRMRKFNNKSLCLSIH